MTAPYLPNAACLLGQARRRESSRASRETDKADGLRACDMEGVRSPGVGT